MNTSRENPEWSPSHLLWTGKRWEGVILVPEFARSHRRILDGWESVFEKNPRAFPYRFFRNEIQTPLVTTFLSVPDDNGGRSFFRRIGFGSTNFEVDGKRALVVVDSYADQENPRPHRVGIEWFPETLSVGERPPEYFFVTDDVILAFRAALLLDSVNLSWEIWRACLFDWFAN